MGTGRVQEGPSASKVAARHVISKTRVSSRSLLNWPRSDSTGLSIRITFDSLCELRVVIRKKFLFLICGAIIELLAYGSS